jgi:hypothetical protein
MSEQFQSPLSAVGEGLLREHLNVGPQKPVSYLPIDTIRKVIGMPESRYVEYIERVGNNALLFESRDCCIKSGAVYAYNKAALDDVLNEYQDMLSEYCWPLDSIGFITRIAQEWLKLEHPIMPVIKKAFGK